jgi:branched-subunit amino acid transport protein
VSDTWLTVALCGAATVVIKAAGPVLLGGRQPQATVLRMLALLGPALLAALVVTNVAAAGDRLVIDARAAGFAVAALLVWRRMPVLVVVIAAAVVTAFVRAIGG